MLAIDEDGRSAACTHKTYLRLQRLRFNRYFSISTHIYLIWGFAGFHRIGLQLHFGDGNDVDLGALSRISCTYNSTSCKTDNARRGLEDMRGFSDFSSSR